MFSRFLGIPLLMAAAIGVPYVATNGPDINGFWNNSEEKPPADSKLTQESPNSNPSEAVATVPGADHFANVTLQEALRFDISKEWVYQRWARKSTALSELGLFGIRVALVTGTQLHDVAGSLTYLFGQDGRVQRISFRGYTGDTTQMVMLVTRSYGLQQQPTVIAGEQLFQVRSGEQVFSELRTRPAPVLRSESLNDSFLVNLELQRPDSTVPLQLELPLPPVESQSSAPQEAISATTDETNAEDVQSAREKWKAFFPRSRVPGEQIDSLDKRGRMW
ncbi:MAG: hypothetical protein KDA57_14390 [Planctomycetales bacterium]|nr:hypothetical protein [Planctomycetales bacterium]